DGGQRGSPRGTAVRHGSAHPGTLNVLSREACVEARPHFLRGYPNTPPSPKCAADAGCRIAAPAVHSCHRSAPLSVTLRFTATISLATTPIDWRPGVRCVYGS